MNDDSVQDIPVFVERVIILDDTGGRQNCTGAVLGIVEVSGSTCPSFSF